MTPEGKVQSHLIKRCKAVGALVRKIRYEGRGGCPDLIITFNAVIHLAECKKDENTPPDPHQVREHARLAARGIKVHIIGSTAQADRFVEEYLI